MALNYECDRCEDEIDNIDEEVIISVDRKGEVQQTHLHETCFGSAVSDETIGALLVS